MNRDMSSNVGIAKKRSVGRFVRAAAAAAALLLGPIAFVAPAQAAITTVELKGWGHFGETIYYGVPRDSNTGKMKFKFKSISHDGSSYQPRLAIGLRNSGGQFARGEAGLGSTAAIGMNSGSATIPASRFYINSRMTGGGCASQCYNWDWAADFTFDKKP